MDNNLFFEQIPFEHSVAKQVLHSAVLIGIEHFIYGIIWFIDFSFDYKYNGK